MPYSLDSDANKENAQSPSHYYTVTEQLLYKIAALDASVQQGFRRIDEKMDRFQTDLHESQIAVNDRINRLDKETAEAFLRKRQRLDQIEAKERKRCEEVDERFTKIETWQSVSKAQVALLLMGITVIWVIFAPTIRHIFGLPG